MATGVVDIGTGVLVAVKTVGDYPREAVSSLAAATAELFMGENAVAIARTSTHIQGVADRDQRAFPEVVVFSDDVVRIFQRCTRHPNIVLVSICRADVNLGMALVRTRSCVAEVDGTA